MPWPIEGAARAPRGHSTNDAGEIPRGGRDTGARRASDPARRLRSLRSGPALSHALRSVARGWMHVSLASCAQMRAPRRADIPAVAKRQADVGLAQAARSVARHHSQPCPQNLCSQDVVVAEAVSVTRATGLVGRPRTAHPRGRGFEFRRGDVKDNPNDRRGRRTRPGVKGVLVLHGSGSTVMARRLQGFEPRAGVPEGARRGAAGFRAPKLV